MFKNSEITIQWHFSVSLNETEEAKWSYIANGRSEADDFRIFILFFAKRIQPSTKTTDISRWMRSKHYRDLPPILQHGRFSLWFRTKSTRSNIMVASFNEQTNNQKEWKKRIGSQISSMCIFLGMRARSSNCGNFMPFYCFICMLSLSSHKFPLHFHFRPKYHTLLSPSVPLSCTHAYHSVEIGR